MKIVIRADRKLDNELIAKHIFKEDRIIDRIVNFLLGVGGMDIYIVSDDDLKVKNVKNISLSSADLLENKQIIDLKFVYDWRKLKKFIKNGKLLEKAVIIENKTIKNLDYFGCFYERSEWNPISQFYVEPFGEKIAFWLRNTKITPNFITALNIILSVFASGLVLLGGTLNLVLFGIWVRMFHVLDVMDGQLARLKSQGTSFGQWFDGAGDRIVLSIWHIVISLALYLNSNNAFFLFLGLAILFGVYIHNYLLFTSVLYFRGSKFDYKSSSRIKKNPLISFVLIFVNNDIQFHILTICAWTNKLNWFLIFYAVYFNFMWLMYFLYYSMKYIREKEVKEV
jgi:phosphatidylglycerophosphate synthase